MATTGSATNPDAIHIPKSSLFGIDLGRSTDAFRNPSVVDAAAGAVVTLLAIIGLTGTEPRVMGAISLMAVGLALVAEATGLMQRSQKLLSENRIRHQITASALAELVAGAFGFVLGVLALFGLEPFVLLALASISFGVALVFGTGAAVQVDTVAAHLEPSPTRRVIHEAVIGASGARFLVALASIVLGLLALAGVERSALLLTSSLILGIALFLGAVSLGDRLRANS
ncbi:MAG TPA: hypothetical protein VFZ53_01080 [Polyangiaceae bacterium]